MPSGSRLALVTLLAVVVLGAMAAHPIGGVTAADSTAGQVETGPTAAGAIDVPPATGAAAIADEDLGRSDTAMRVRLTADGDARWRVSTWINLSGEEDRAAFRDVGEAWERGAINTPWLTAFRQARSEASRATGREMRIHSIDRSWSINESTDGNATGHLALTFTWTNFAQVSDEGRRLEVGDVFSTAGGASIRLEPGQTLIIEPPPDYTPVTGSGDLRDRSFYWEGPQSFESNPPSAIFTGGGGLPTLMVASLLVAGLATLLLFAYLLASRRGTRVDHGDEPDAEAAAATAGTTAGSEATGGVVGADDSADAEEADDVDLELLSDEERVERLLEQNGGRMKQASIVKETGWSNAKVSQLLSAMDEADRIDKLRIGRENLISFPDEDIADIEE